SARSSNLPSQTIPNPRGNASVVTLRSGKELPQPTLQQLPRSAKADSEPNANSQSQPEKTVPAPFPTRIISARRPESDKELLKMFRKAEINIPLLDAIKQVSKYAKFLKELCVHKTKKIKGSREFGGVVSALTRNEEFIAGAQALPKKCRDPGIFSVPCTIGECTFADAMLDLGASINVMPASIYRSLNFGDLQPTGMTIQLANRSIVQPLGVLEDVLVQNLLSIFQRLGKKRSKRMKEKEKSRKAAKKSKLKNKELQQGCMNTRKERKRKDKKKGKKCRRRALSKTKASSHKLGESSQLRPTPSQPSQALQPSSSRCRSLHALVYIGVVVYILGVFGFTLYALSSSSLSSIYGGAQCCIGVSLDQGSTSLRLGSRSLSEGTDSNSNALWWI
ncbi:hypothetical protein CR513_10092, partial [Mucuna pruriens]